MKNIVKKIVLSVLSLTAMFASTAKAADLSGWAVPEYRSANEAGLVSYSVVSQNLKDDITRQEFCELAMNLYKKLTNENLITPMGSPFWDTNNVAVAQAYSYGIVSGTSDATFSPNRLVTREEMAKMLVSTLAASEVSFELSDGSEKYLVDGFRDAGDISKWAEASVITALNNALINGVTEELLDPLGSTTREQAIASVNRAYNAFKTDSYSVELPEITLPSDGSVIEEGDFRISWTSIPGASSYHVIIKDSGANSVVLEDIYSSTSHTVKRGLLKATREYSLIVGAVLADGSEVYSLPVDFTYKRKAVTATQSPSYNQSSTTQTTPAYTANSAKAQAVLDTAAKYLGVPYVWGGTTPAGFDCSGFVQYVLAQNGIKITRTTYTQWDNDGVFVSKSELQPGDLVYFGSDSAPGHVGLYVGGGTYIHSPRTGDVVKYSSLDSRSDYCGAKRVIF